MIFRGKTADQSSLYSFKKQLIFCYSFFCSWCHPCFSLSPMRLGATSDWDHYCPHWHSVQITKYTLQKLCSGLDRSAYYEEWIRQYLQVYKLSCHATLNTQFDIKDINLLKTFWKDLCESCFIQVNPKIFQRKGSIAQPKEPFRSVDLFYFCRPQRKLIFKYSINLTLQPNSVFLKSTYLNFSDILCRFVVVWYSSHQNISTVIEAFWHS